MPGFNNMNQMEAPSYDGPIIGLVVDNNDPDQRQRVKVTIQGLLEGKKEDLPWIAPKSIQTGFGITKDAGGIFVPAMDSLLVMEFQKGDLHYGLCVGSMHTARYTPDPDLLKNYPDRRGWHDTKKNKMWVDVTEGEATMHLEHFTLTMINVEDSGEVNITVVKDCNVEVKGTLNIVVKGDTNITTDGDTKIVTKGQTDINSSGNTNITGEMINLNNS